MAKKTYQCPFCKKKYIDKSALYDHMTNEHNEELCGLPAAQIYFNFRNKYQLTKGNGRSIISGKPTKFNLSTERYEKFADEKEREQFRQLFRQRMISKYGKDTLLDEPDQQKKMLAGRNISGVYIWQNGHKTQYTGSYEKLFLEHLDIMYGWQNPEDVSAPSCHTFTYEYDGKVHFHIPDFEIESLNLIVNIKSSENTGYRLRDIEAEKLEDEAIRKSNFNYIKIYDNDFEKFDKLLDTLVNEDNVRKRYFIL